ncbi:hypothetical protein ACIBF6_32375 [Streptosporangium amethystogenes]
MEPLDHPDDPVRVVIFPAVSGGEQTLKDLVHVVLDARERA